jgi:hypothetical protein
MYRSTGVSCFQGHLNKCPLGDLNKCPLGDLNKCPLGDLNKSPWENYLEGGGSEEIINSTRFCKVHFVLNSDIKIVIATFTFPSIFQTTYHRQVPTSSLCLYNYFQEY